MTTQAPAQPAIAKVAKTRIQELLDGMAEEMGAAYTQVGKDIATGKVRPENIASAYTAVGDSFRAKANEKAANEAKAKQALFEKQKGALDAFRPVAEAALNGAWDKVSASFEKLTAYKSLTFMVTRGEDGKLGKPVLSMGIPPKARAASNGTAKAGKGSQGVTVLGVSYTSHSAAMRALGGDPTAKNGPTMDSWLRSKDAGFTCSGH